MQRDGRAPGWANARCFRTGGCARGRAFDERVVHTRGMRITVFWVWGMDHSGADRSECAERRGGANEQSAVGRTLDLHRKRFFSLCRHFETSSS